MGAPESGKSELAEKLAEALKPKSSFIVDNYVEEISKEAGVMIFPLSPYIGNLLVALKRFAYENRNSDYGDHIISVGTILDTQLYEAIEGQDSERFAPYEDQHTLRVEAALQVLGCLFMDSFIYDVAFLNVYEGENKDWQGYTEQLKNVLKIYEVQYHLLEGDIDTRVTTALDLVKKAQKENETENADGLRVPGSRAQSPTNGDAAEPVSNVRVETSGD